MRAGVVRKLIAGVALVGAVTSGCSNSSSIAEGEGSPTTVAKASVDATTTTVTVPPSTTTTFPQRTWTPEEQPIVDAYIGFSRAFNRASRGESEIAELAKFGTGDLLTSNRVLLTSKKNRGERSRTGPAGEPTYVVSKIVIEPGVGYFDACEFDDSVRFRVADETVIEDKPVTRPLSVRVS